jgi:hypothetical protein
MPALLFGVEVYRFTAETAGGAPRAARIANVLQHWLRVTRW